MSRSFVRTQKIKEIKGDSDSYSRWNEKHSIKRQKGKLADKFDFAAEDVLANPDSLCEDETIYANDQPSTPQFLMGEAVEKLVGRQKECYLLTMREGKSLAETAAVLGISKGTVQTYKERAIRFIEGYCAQAIKGGRV